MNKNDTEVLDFIDQWRKQNKRGPRTDEIATLTGIHRSTCVGIVSKLERHGLVSRDGSTGKDSFLLLELTSKGRDVLDTMLGEPEGTVITMTESQQKSVIVAEGARAIIKAFDAVVVTEALHSIIDAWDYKCGPDWADNLYANIEFARSQLGRPSP